MVLHAEEATQGSAHVLDCASKLDPVNVQPKYQRAKVLQSMGRLEAALEELKKQYEIELPERQVYICSWDNSTRS